MPFEPRTLLRPRQKFHARRETFVRYERQTVFPRSAILCDGAHRFSRIDWIKRRVKLEISVRRKRGKRHSLNHGAAVPAGPLNHDSQLCPRVPVRDLEYLQLQNRYPVALPGG